MDQRLSGMETHLGDLRERVASLEAGVKFSMTTLDLRTLEQRHMQAYHELTASIADLKATMDSHIKQTAARVETLRYYRSIFTPLLAGLVIYLITGSLDLTKIGLGMGK